LASIALRGGSRENTGIHLERNRLGLVSATEYTSRGDWLQSAVQYGNFGASSYAAEFGYRKTS